MKKHLVKAAAFAAIFVVIFQKVSKVVTTPSDYRNYQWIAGFYEEPEDTLDAVYFGSSNCYAFWNPMTAWEEFGLAVYPYACNSQSFIATEYLLKEARKTQPDALFIVNVNTINDKATTIEKVHHLLDYMPFSLNKANLINCLADVGEFSMSERMELFFPILRYHSRWSELIPADLKYELNGLKGASNYSSYLKGEADIEDEYYLSTEVSALSDEYKEIIEHLLDYCEEEQLNILFVTVPRAEKSAETVQKINWVNEIIESRGFPTLYLLDQAEEIGLDLSRDYYNDTHTNVHGSIRYTQYLSQYLIEQYGFENKRGQEAYSSWEEGWEKYERILAPYVLEIERDAEHQDPDLAMPEELKATKENDRVLLSWEGVDQAGQYAVYRKTGAKGAWEQLAMTAENSYIDEFVSGQTEYFYTVVPVRLENQQLYYGRFSYDGVSVKV